MRKNITSKDYKFRFTKKQFEEFKSGVSLISDVRYDSMAWEDDKCGMIWTATYLKNTLNEQIKIFTY